ncbi:MAG TPA: hypothetical protein VF163_14815 [Micromonosporaceae bacterium]
MVVQDQGEQAGAYLSMLLKRPGDARSAWEKFSSGAAPGEIDYAAVAQVLRHRGAPAREPEAARAALGEGRLAPATLTEFIDAFHLTPRHAGRLHRLLDGCESVRVITESDLVDLKRLDTGPQPDTLALHELHTIGPDGLPAEHQTIQVIQATTDNLTAYPYRFDTNELVVEVVRGGRVGELFRVSDGLFGVSIVLDQPLNTGETSLMHHRFTFFYKNPPPTQFRRGVLGTMRDVTLWLQFHPSRPPARIWSGVWDRLDQANAVEQREVRLDSDFSVQARYDSVTDSIVGFHWVWG